MAGGSSWALLVLASGDPGNLPVEEDIALLKGLEVDADADETGVCGVLLEPFTGAVCGEDGVMG